VFTKQVRGDKGTRVSVLDPSMNLEKFLEIIEGTQFAGLHIGGPKDMDEAVNPILAELTRDVKKEDAWRHIIHLGFAASNNSGSGYQQVHYLCRLTKPNFQVVKSLYQGRYNEPFPNWRAEGGRRPLTYEDCKP